MPLNLVTAPTDEPILLAEAKRQCAVPSDVSEHDQWFDEAAIPAARERCEGATRRQLFEAEYTLLLDAFPSGDVLELPKPPLISVDSIQFVDWNGTLQTWASSNYLVQAPAGPRCRRGRVTPVYGTTWPVVRQQMGAVVVAFTCGYGTEPADVPALLRQAQLMDIGTMFEHRESIVIEQGTVVAIEVPRGSKSIYEQFKSRPRWPLTGID